MEGIMFLLVGIIALCAMAAAVEGLVWVWEKIDPPAEVKVVHAHDVRR